MQALGLVLMKALWLFGEVGWSSIESENTITSNTQHSSFCAIISSYVSAIGNRFWCEWSLFCCLGFSRRFCVFFVCQKKGVFCRFREYANQLWKHASFWSDFYHWWKRLQRYVGVLHWYRRRTLRAVSIGNNPSNTISYYVARLAMWIYYN